MDCSEANGNGGHGGIIARELNSGSSAAVGLLCQNGSLSVAYWQDTLNLIDSVELPTGVKEVWVRMDVELLLIKPWYSLDGYAWDWVKAKGHIHDDPQVQVSLFLSFILSFFLSFLLTFLLFLCVCVREKERKEREGDWAKKREVQRHSLGPGLFRPQHCLIVYRPYPLRYMYFFNIYIYIYIWVGGGADVLCCFVVAQMAFIYGANYRVGWEMTHSANNTWRYPLSFTTFHPGLFAGGVSTTSTATSVQFDYWNYTDNEVWPE